MTDQSEQQKAMKLAHVLFMDIVDYSRLPTDQQTKVVQTLQEIVLGTAEVTRAQATDQIINIATGDGMALVFFNDPMAPVQCAMEISRALKRRRPHPSFPAGRRGFGSVQQLAAVSA